MAIKHTNEPNPLNVHNLRKLKHCPPHFEQVIFDLYTNESKIINWIYDNLDKRFYAGYHDVKADGKVIRSYRVAFENHSEASHFSLLLSEINK